MNVLEVFWYIIGPEPHSYFESSFEGKLKPFVEVYLFICLFFGFFLSLATVDSFLCWLIQFRKKNTIYKFARKLKTRWDFLLCVYPIKYQM